ncbi:FKBP-type peptidyl-prolyl cis-trans isomerase [Hymenobacter sp. NST-14]|uniref:FKBP-type peptidyl-prolyl cis-trans isomerase n=1 Tax=Hymenobacter piscis TaxID=2839984 RepID=UPI001C019DF5|nr:FKBP-type peptidyl-prolyl cis-trans isomerase [Hymenobacter piscis]MBT9393514.1 FKBP-type peptidyl-prolyl cis-trans isomerase [Hymenobacter piscis]
MKYSLPLFFLFLLTLLGSCKKDDEKDTAPAQAALDEAAIQAYIQANNLTGFQRQTSGLYVAITQPGTGDNAKDGQVVKVMYKGTTLDGNVFDSNPTTLGFPFQLGKGKVIAGWDEAFKLLNEGSKAILLIPSALAYGASGSGSIPPNAVLRFDVEVVDIK